MSGRILPTILENGGDFQKLGQHLLFGPLNVGLGTVMAPLGMSIRLLSEDQGPIRVDPSVFLDPLVLCP